MPLPAGTQLGRYEVIEAIGAGGMGEVYRARDGRLDRTVALKVLPADRADEAEARARLDREARAIAGLNHPNICALYDIGHDQGRDFLVMELLEGQTLQQRLDRGPLSTAELVDCAIPLADALDTAHAHGLIHRDLKPANVFITSKGAPKILDFGLAKSVIEPAYEVTRRAEAGLTGFGTTVGTVAYMSPEQLRGEPLDVRTDLFSFGLVLYEMATGQRAFVGPTTAVVSAAILGQEPVTPRSLRPELPARLDDIILKAIEKDRDLRCQSAAELRADLTRLRREISSGSARTQPAAVADLAATTLSVPITRPASAPTTLTAAPVSSPTVPAATTGSRRSLMIGIAIGIVAVGSIVGAFLIGRENPGASENAATATAANVASSPPAPSEPQGPGRGPESTQPPAPNRAADAMTKAAAPPSDATRDSAGEPGRSRPPLRGSPGMGPGADPGFGRGPDGRFAGPPPMAVPPPGMRGGPPPSAATGPQPPPGVQAPPMPLDGRPVAIEALPERGGRGRGGRGPLAGSLVASLRNVPPETYELVLAAGDVRAHELGATLRAGLDAVGWTCAGTTEQASMPVPFAIVVPKLSPSAAALANWARRNGIAADYRVLPRLPRMRVVIGPQPQN